MKCEHSLCTKVQLASLDRLIKSLLASKWHLEAFALRLRGCSETGKVLIKLLPISTKQSSVCAAASVCFEHRLDKRYLAGMIGYSFPEPWRLTNLARKGQKRSVWKPQSPQIRRKYGGHTMITCASP
ncbi:hypothetical protein Bca4012_037947 [Brassica carinata]